MWRLLPRGTSDSPNGNTHCYSARRPILMTTGLSLLCPLSWDWAPPQTLTYPLHPFSPQNPRAKGLFTFPKSVYPSAGLSI